MNYIQPMMQNEIEIKNRLEWYVMRCRKTDKLAENIRKFNEKVNDFLRVDDVFVPATCFLRAKKEDRRPEETKMGNTLRRYVFLKVCQEGLLELLGEPWQQAHDYRLYHYYDRGGHKLTTSDSMMTRFKIACEEYGTKFEICTLPSASQEIEEGITVKVREGAFKGFEAEVVHVHHTGKEILLTVSVKVFGNTYARINGLKVSDVIVSDADAPVFNLRFIDQVEVFLLDALRQKVKERHLTWETEEQLRDYYRLRNATFGDADVHDRFDALMSICASLLQSTSGKTRYNKRLKLRIKALRESQDSLSVTISLAWLLTALFVSTRDADYRTELKSLIPTISPRPESLCRFLSIIRQL